MKCKIQYNIYCLDEKTLEEYVYTGLNGNTWLLFNEAISINPHNLLIQYVNVLYTELNSEREHCIQFVVYQTRRESKRCISNIKNCIEESSLNKIVQNELLYFTDLWLTKFVPDKLN